MWSWAAHNVRQDNKEQERLLFSFMDALTWWLQPQMRKQMEKDKASQMPDADAEQFARDLREAGADEAYIEKEVAAILAERAKKAEVEEIMEDGDQMEVLRGPARA